MKKVYIDSNCISRVSKRENNKNKIKSNNKCKCEVKESLHQRLPLEPVLVDRIYDNVKVIGNENSPKCIEFEIISPCSLPFDTKIEILETKTTVKVKKLCNKIFIQGHEINLNYNLCNYGPNTINLDKSLVNLCNHKEYCDFDLKVNEWIEACVEVEIVIRGMAYFWKCNKKCFEAIGCVEDKVCVPLMYNICVPNFIKDREKPYLRQSNDIKGLVDPSFVFLSPVPDCNCCIEKLLGKLVISYCVDSNMQSIVHSTLGLITSGKVKPREGQTDRYYKFNTIHNKKRA